MITSALLDLSHILLGILNKKTLSSNASSVFTRSCYVLSYQVMFDVTWHGVLCDSAQSIEESRTALVDLWSKAGVQGRWLFFEYPTVLLVTSMDRGRNSLTKHDNVLFVVCIFPSTDYLVREVADEIVFNWTFPDCLVIYWLGIHLGPAT